MEPLEQGNDSSTSRQSFFLSAQRRFENIRIPASEIKKHVCYECGDIINDPNEYQEHLLAHEVVNISYQLYHRERARPSPRKNGHLHISSDESDDDNKNILVKRKQDVRRKRSSEHKDSRPNKIFKLSSIQSQSFPDNLATEHETEFSNDSVPFDNPSIQNKKPLTSFAEIRSPNEFSPDAFRFLDSTIADYKIETTTGNLLTSKNSSNSTTTSSNQLFNILDDNKHEKILNPQFTNFIRSEYMNLVTSEVESLMDNMLAKIDNDLKVI